MDSLVMRLVQGMRPDARYKALLEHLPDALVVVFDDRLRLLAIEGGSTDRLVEPASHYIGKTVDEILTPAAADEIRPQYQAALAGDKVSFDHVGRDGTVWWIQAVPVCDDGGRITGGMASWRDVTERATAEVALAERAQALERSNRELEQFAYVASHDLAEPLRMITAYLSLLERRYAATLDEDARQFIGHAVDGAARMRTLIDDLLQFSRVGRAENANVPVAVQGIVDDAFRTLTAGREDDAGSVRLAAADLPTVSGDEQQLNQLFQNLLGNALKFSGGPAEVEVTAEPLDGRWLFTVADRGIGIGADDTERVFGMFERLHSTDAYPGTGVGLAIARKVVEHHGGRIWAEPRPGGGTLLRFDLGPA